MEGYDSSELAREKLFDDSYNEFVEILDQIEPWTKIEDPAVEGLQVATNIQKFDDWSDEKLNRFVWNYEREFGTDLACQSKMFLLVRYRFPLVEPCDESEWHFFGGWIGVPVREGKVDCLWPWRMDENGKLLLSSCFGGYAGAPYSAADEFRFFATKYAATEIR